MSDILSYEDRPRASIYTGISTSSYGQVIEVADPLDLAEGDTLESANAPPTPISPSSVTGNSSQRTLEDVREQAAQSVAVRSIRKSEVVDGTKVGVVLTLGLTSPASDGALLSGIASSIKRMLIMQSYLFVLTAPARTPADASPVLVLSDSDETAQRAGLLVCAKFPGRVVNAGTTYGGRGRWIGAVRNLGSSSYDDDALWDAVRKAARKPVDPTVPPSGSRSVDQLLAQARARLQRITPRQAFDELRDTAALWPVVLVDIRPEAQRLAHGGIHGSLLVERNVLEWRFDPRCEYRLPVANRYDLRVIVFCQEGYTSSLAAAALQDLGLLNATDVIGGYAAWVEDGLPAEVEVASERSTVFGQTIGPTVPDEDDMFD